MDATTTLSTNLLVDKLRQQFPQFTFIEDDNFFWSPQDASIHFLANSGEVGALLHETAHALLGHSQYTRAIQLIEMERDAWAYAQNTLASQLNMNIAEDEIQDHLDSYRNWLHSRSLCPTCQANGLETKKDSFQCPACLDKWTVNESRTCQLRRYRAK